ncbi:DUF885 domain-containing protein [Salinimonas sp. HHU 13199]|uniref:DUF885 domain-containing protein n=1 Tax=Salinimonas profundi TaxID=2729140 RepID=A0ABR8LU22_9ALTE|nr:DUF885 domain-containing protein [Salinimonas profundi]MBD3587644.1 DUF885 domain-containing protein [Salinimonas profundi]
MNAIKITLFIILTSGFLSSVSQAETTADEQLQTLIDAIWEYETSLDEVVPTDISPSALSAQHQQYSDYLSELQTIDTAQLSEDDRITLLMQQYRLNNKVDEYEFGAFKVPITSEYGFHSALASLPGQMSFKNKEDYQTYLEQLAGVPAYVDQQIDYMKQGLKEGYTQPKLVLEGYEESITPLISESPEKSPFYAPFESISEFVGASAQNALRKQARQIISDEVTPAFQRFYDFMVETYIPGARTDIAAKNWPDGEAYYQNRIKHYTTTDMTAQEIHDLGLQEVKRIREQMKAIVEDVEFDGDVDAFIHFLRTDEQFYATSARELLKEASFIAKKADAQLPRFFEKIPRKPYGVAPVPDDIAPKYTTGRYIHAGSDTQPGYYWVNTYALDKRPLYALPALTLHEAVPGHHLQISLAGEMENLPPVRQETYISAFGEGWGLYTEFLGVEMGIYETPYDHFGRLSYEMWRACRLVVDTGMHMFGWSRQEAIDYMMKNTALSAHNIKTEVDRYISWPGQALSYKIGEIKIKSLRKKAEKALGSSFDVRQFHTAVLEHGSVPLFILEQNIERFIEEQQAGK